MSYTKSSPTVTLAGVLLSTTLIAGAVLASTSASADDSVVDDVNITVPVSCTMKGTGNNSHNKDIVNGTYESEIGTTTLKAFCNDNGGFAIYAAGYTGEEIGGENSTKLVNSALSANNTIVTGTAISAGDPDVSNWAMKLTANNTGATYPITLDNGFGSYSAVPNEYTKVAHRDQGTDIETVTNAQGSTLSTTYAAYVSRTQPAGTYSGKVIYTMVHPSLAPAPGSTLIMQEVANWKDSLNIGDEVEAVDTRDNKTYQVAKLADGNIWMTQNLDLDIDSNTTYTHDDTDLGYGTSTTTTWLPERSTYETGYTDWDNLGEDETTGNSLAFTHPESYDPGTLYWNGTLWPQDQTTCEANQGTWSDDWCDNPVLTSTTGTPNHHLGNYYNWTASLAMNDSSSITTDGTKVDQSICPAGWTLPIGGSTTDNKSFQNLVSQYGWDSGSQMMKNPNIWNSPIKLSLSGYWYGGEAPDYVGNDGSFWSSVARSTGNANFLYASSGGYVDPDNFVNRRNGFSVRCISR